jgi:hypothetical protein
MDGDAVDAVFVDALRRKSARWPECLIRGACVRAAAQEWCRSNPTSEGRRHCQDHTSMPLGTLSRHGTPASSDKSRTSAETFLALLQFLEQTEVAGNFGGHRCAVVEGGVSLAIVCMRNDAV